MSTVDTAKAIFEHRLQTQREEFGSLLIRKRLRRGLSVVGMGKKIGVHHSQIVRWEKGKTVPTYLPTVMAVAECYRLSSVEKNRWYELVFGFLHTSHEAFVSVENPEEIFELNPEVADFEHPEPLNIEGTNRIVLAKISKVIIPLLNLTTHWISWCFGLNIQGFRLMAYAEDDERTDEPKLILHMWTGVVNERRHANPRQIPAVN